MPSAVRYQLVRVVTCCLNSNDLDSSYSLCRLKEWISLLQEAAKVGLCQWLKEENTEDGRHAEFAILSFG